MQDCSLRESSFGKEIREKFTRGFFSGNQFLQRKKDVFEQELVYLSVEFTKFLYHNFLKNFRESNFFSKEIYCKIDS